MNDLSRCCRPHFKCVENICRRIAFNLGNTPSQTEVKIISCIPIDVSELQTKITELEKELEECRQLEGPKHSHEQPKAQQSKQPAHKVPPPQVIQTSNVSVQTSIISAKHPSLQESHMSTASEILQSPTLEAAPPKKYTKSQKPLQHSPPKKSPAPQKRPQHPSPEIPLTPQESLEAAPPEKPLTPQMSLEVTPPENLPTLQKPQQASQPENFPTPQKPQQAAPPEKFIDAPNTTRYRPVCCTNPPPMCVPRCPAESVCCPPRCHLFPTSQQYGQAPQYEQAAPVSQTQHQFEHGAPISQTQHQYEYATPGAPTLKNNQPAVPNAALTFPPGYRPIDPYHPIDPMCTPRFCPIDPMCPPGWRPVEPVCPPGYRLIDAVCSPTMQQYRQTSPVHQYEPAAPSVQTSSHQYDVTASAQTSQQYEEATASAQTSQPYEEDDPSTQTSRQYEEDSPSAWQSPHYHQSVPDTPSPNDYGETPSPVQYRPSASSSTSVEILIRKPQPQSQSQKHRHPSPSSMHRMRMWWHSRQHASASSSSGATGSENCSGYSSNELKRHHVCHGGENGPPCSSCLPLAINKTEGSHQLPQFRFYKGPIHNCKNGGVTSSGFFKNSSKMIRGAINNLFYHVQPYTNSPFRNCDEIITCSRRDALSPGNVSSSYLEEVAHKQFDPAQVAMIKSASSRFSTPICRDEHPSPDGQTRVSEVDSCCQMPSRPTCGGYSIDVEQRRGAGVELYCECDGFLDVDRHRYRSSADPGQSTAEPLPTSDYSAYYDSSLYDVVPVRDTPRTQNIDKTPRNAKQRKNLQLKPHLAMHNGHLPAKGEKIPPANVPFKHGSHKRVLRQNSIRKIRHLDTQTGSVDFSEVYTKPFVRNRIRKMKSRPKNMQHRKIDEQKEAECLTINLTHKECQTAAISNSVELQPPTSDPAFAQSRVEQTLDQIKGILHSVLVEVKSSIPRPPTLADTRDCSPTRGPLGSSLCPKAPPTLLPPIQPIYAEKNTHNDPMFVNRTAHQCSCCFPTVPSCQPAATNIDSVPRRSKATEKLVKEIYKSLAVSTQPPRETSTSSGSDVAGSMHSAPVSRATASGREASARATLSNCEAHPSRYGSTKPRRDNTRTATTADDSGAAIAHLQPEKKINLFNKIRRLFKSMWEYDQEMQSSEAEECNSDMEDYLMMCGQLHPNQRTTHRYAHTKIMEYMGRGDRHRPKNERVILHHGDPYRP